MNYVIAFAAMAALDFVWGNYTRNVADGRRVPSALWAAGIVFFNATVTLAYVGDHWTILPAAAGAFVGTYFSVKPK